MRFDGHRRTVLGVVVAEAAVASRFDSSLLYGFHSLSCSEQSGWDRGQDTTSGFPCPASLLSDLLFF